MSTGSASPLERQKNRLSNQDVYAESFRIPQNKDSPMQSKWPSMNWLKPARCETGDQNPVFHFISHSGGQFQPRQVILSHLLGVFDFRGGDGLSFCGWPLPSHTSKRSRAFGDDQTMK